MKTLRLLTIVLCFVPALYSCQKQQPVAPDPTIDTSVSHLDIAGSGGEYTFILTTNSAWTIAGDASWVTISPKSGVAGDHKIVVKAQANPSADIREMNIAMSAGKLVVSMPVSQSGKASVDARYSKTRLVGNAAPDVVIPIR